MHSLSPRFPVTNSKYPVIGSRFPVKDSKQPIGLENIGKKLEGISPEVAEAQQSYLDNLYEQYSKLVYGRVQKYLAGSFGADIDDLHQDCWARIITKLHTFNPERGKFSTWSWRVCQSVLNKGYRRRRKLYHRYPSLEEGLDENRIEDKIEDKSVSNELLRRDMKQALSELMQSNPEVQDILFEMVGGLHTGASLPDRINYREIARKTGTNDARVSKVFKTILQPFFKERFSEHSPQERVAEKV